MPAAADDASAGRVVVADDDPSLRSSLERALRVDGYEVHIAEDGGRALDAVSTHRPDVLVLDVTMPVMDGLDVCRILRREGNDLPILMLTARDTVEDRIHGLDTGADDYLTKPFEFGELLARMRALLRRPRGEMLPTTIAVGDLEIDTLSQTARAKGRPIPLTTKEYSLLQYFARNANRVIGREEISEHVWNENFDPFSNLIEVYVNRLRQKISENMTSPALKTRRGAGYILETEE